jgi:hypothetical protein
MVTIRALLLLLCLVGGCAGVFVGISRRETITALTGLIVVALATYGLF